MNNRIVRAAILTATLLFAAFVGFYLWRSLWSLVYGGVAVLAALMGGSLFAWAKFRKRESELTPIFFGCAAIAGWMFAIAMLRAEITTHAMVAESHRLVQRAEEFRKKEGSVPLSASVLVPRDSSERLAQWLAGDTVRYLAKTDGYFVTRGISIFGETYSSYTGQWEITKM